MKTLNINLIKHTIKTDFFIVNNEKQKETKQFKNLSSKNFNVLDVIELNFSIKQLIRILQFIKKNKNNVNIVSSNKLYLKIFKSFFTKNKNFIQNNLLFNERVLKKKNSITPTHNDLNIFINNKSEEDLLTLEINTMINYFCEGKYKIFNDLNSFKKLIFFISIIKNVLKIQKP